MKQFKIYVILISFIFIFGCNEEDKLDSCNNSTSEFHSIFKNMTTSGHKDIETFDTEVHEYSFTLTANKEICKIGYQSQPGVASTAYLIEIIDNSSNVIIYSNNHTFSSTTTSYATPSLPVNLQSGISYTIKRIQLNWGSNIGNTIGRISSKSPMDFPYSNGIMTITSANFYQNGGPLTDLGVPYIDLLLK